MLCIIAMTIHSSFAIVCLMWLIVAARACHACLIFNFVWTVSCFLLAGTTIDYDWLERELHLACAATGGLEVLDDLQTGIVGNLAEDDVLAIEPGGNDGGDEELGAIPAGYRD